MKGIPRSETERRLAFLAGLGAVMLLVSCERPAKAVASAMAEKSAAAILIDQQSMLFSDFLEAAGVLSRDAPVRFRYPELGAEVVIGGYGSNGAIAACGPAIQVREAEVLMDQEVVSLPELEAKLRVYAEAAAAAQSIPLLAINSHRGVSFARGLEVLQVLAKAEIRFVEVSDPAIAWEARAKARPEAPWQAKPVKPGGR